MKQEVQGDSNYADSEVTTQINSDGKLARELQFELDCHLVIEMGKKWRFVDTANLGKSLEKQTDDCGQILFVVRRGAMFQWQCKKPCPWMFWANYVEENGRHWCIV